VEHLEIILAALFIAAAGLNAVARWLDVPYPIPLVIGGLLLGLVPGMPEVELEPELVLVIFLPPLLYSAAFFADLRSLRADLRVITLQAVGLVLFTTFAVAWVSHEVIDLPWAVAFALGAIVAPTDPVAATSIMRRLGAPRRLVNIVEGESLVNDASALVIYRVAVAAAVGGTFSVAGAGAEFVGAAAGGIAIGLAAGWAVGQIRKRLNDPVTEVTISLFTAYGAFIPADELGLSGVLAAVTCGVYLGWRAPEIASPETRLQAFPVWEILTFLLNATLFILIGLQLPVVFDGLSVGIGEAIAYSLLVWVVVVGARAAWSLLVTTVVRGLDRRPVQRARRASWQVHIVGIWSGMRGAVSLAAALALPLETDAGDPLPGRDLILFITFALILLTVVGQGLTLPGLIRRLGVEEDGTEEEREELRARYGAAQAALDRLGELEAVEWTRDDTVDRVRRMYEFRRRRVKVLSGKIEDEDGIQEQSLAYQRLMHELYAAQRAKLVRLRNEGEISSEVMRRVEHELDLEESRLEV
jgi:monovalent cation/hydrogen antiporter